MMKNVAKRMLNKSLTHVIISWRRRLKADKSERMAQESAERIMKRVSGRWANRDVSDALRSWRSGQLEEKAQLHAETLLKRVGARMRSKELAWNFSEFVRNAKNDRENMWRNRVAKMQAELDAMHLQFTLKTQVIRQLTMKNDCHVLY